jgi:hypothetical protein
VAHNGAEATVAQLRPKPDLEELQVLLRGLAHVDRLQIILAPVQLGAVAYHVRFLRDRDLLKQVREEPRRGALEHFYAITDEGLRMKKWLRL